MKVTLYEQAKDIENIYEKLRDLNVSNQINVIESQRDLFKKYEGNPVLYDAMQGRQSIEESLEELGKINKGVRKILPWRKNKGHNERLKQLGELVAEPYHLHTSGVFAPDNFITTAIEFAPFLFGLSYLLNSNFAMPNVFEASMAVSAFSASLAGVLMNTNRFSELPIDEAKYLDGKVQEFYR